MIFPIKKYLPWTYFLVLLTLILTKNPTLFSSKPLHDQKDRQNHQLFSTKIDDSSSSDSDIDSTPLSTYRTDIEHSGEFTEQSTKMIRPKKIWSVENVNLGIHGASKSSPAVDSGGIYIGSDSGFFYHYNWKGNLVWKWWLPENYRGIHSTALITKDSVFFAAYNGKLYCLDKKSGKPRWVAKLGEAIGSSPIIADGYLYVTVETVQTLGGYLVKVDPASGGIIWKTEDFGEQSHSSPTFDSTSGTIYLGANNSKLYAISSKTGELLWSLPTSGPVKSTPTLVKDSICYTDWGSKFRCFDTTSKIPNIDFNLNGASQISPAYSKSNDFLLAGDGAGYLFAFSASKKTILWKHKVSDEKTLGSPSLFSVESVLHIAGPCQVKAWCIWRANPFQKLFSSSGKGKLTGSPVIHENFLVLSFDSPGDLEVWSLDGLDNEK